MTSILNTLKSFAVELIALLVILIGTVIGVSLFHFKGLVLNEILTPILAFLTIFILLTASLIFWLFRSHNEFKKQHQNLLAILQSKEDAEAKLEAEELRFQSMFETSPDPTWIIDGHQFTLCNRAAVQILGYASKEELSNTHPSKLSPEIQPDGEPSFAKAERMMHLAEERGLHRFEWIHTRLDGSNFPAEVTLSRMTMKGRPVIYCVWRDITQRKRSENENKLAATVFAHTADGIIITDEKAKIVSVNLAFTTITGYTAEEAIGQNPNILHSGRQDAAFYEAMWQSILDSGTWQGEIWNRRKNGEIFPEWQTITSVKNVNGEIINFVSVFSDISVIKRSQAEFEHLAHFDALTELPNRVLFKDRVAHALGQAQRSKKKLAVILFDLDGFKTVNDSLGHPVGDRLLQLVAQRLKTCVRTEDTVARLGGDEFAVLLSDLDNGEDAIQVARKILLASQEPYSVEGHAAIVTTSIGIAIYPDDAENNNDLIRNADAAMYEAKAKGRNTYRFYQAEMTLSAQKRLASERDLRRAIENDEFEIWYQPQIDLASNLYLGAEALLRWRDPVRGLIPPLDFIPLAELNGMILPIGEIVLHQVCADIRQWIDAGVPAKRLAVNVAGPQFYRSDFVATLSRHVERYQIPRGALEIEVTETFMMENPQEIKEILNAIQAMGITTAIDDFGTGYSSLAYLKELPIDTLKIDRAFVKNLPSNVSDIAIIRAILALGHSMGFNIIAEGIETAEQREFLQTEGCKEGQGYYFAKPMAKIEFMAWLERQVLLEDAA
ncbi:MAG: EAL domain-containing protein [Pseudomonadota bacterium]